MKVFDPDNLTQTIKIVPRFDPDLELLVYTLKDSVTEVKTVLTVVDTYVDGFLTATFDFSSEENNKGEITVTQGAEIVYRGQYISTSQDTQNYQLTYLQYE